MGQPTANEGLGALVWLIGEWALEARGPDGEPWPGEGRVTFEWLPSDAHVIQRTTTDVPSAPDSTSIIGCDGGNGTYAQLYSDERGVCRIYEMTITQDLWTLQRVGEPFPQRFLGQLSDDGRTIEGRWEKAENGSNYTVDFFLTYRRRDPT